MIGQEDEKVVMKFNDFRKSCGYSFAVHNTYRKIIQMALRSALSKQGHGLMVPLLKSGIHTPSINFCVLVYFHPWLGLYTPRQTFVLFFDERMSVNVITFNPTCSYKKVMLRFQTLSIV